MHNFDHIDLICKDVFTIPDRSVSWYEMNYATLWAACGYCLRAAYISILTKLFMTYICTRTGSVNINMINDKKPPKRARTHKQCIVWNNYTTILYFIISNFWTEDKC